MRRKGISAIPATPTGTEISVRTPGTSRPTKTAAQPRRANQGMSLQQERAAMIFELAEKRWRCLDGHNPLPRLIPGVKFVDGIGVVRSQAQAAVA